METISMEFSILSTCWPQNRRSLDLKELMTIFVQRTRIYGFKLSANTKNRPGKLLSCRNQTEFKKKLCLI